MFELSAIQIIIVLVVALLVFGPKRLPELGRQLGRGMRELKGHMNGMTEGIMDPPDDPPRQAQQAPAAAAPVAPADDDVLLDGVVVSGATPDAPPAPAAAVAAADDDALLDGVVVSGATPPQPPHPAG